MTPPESRYATRKPSGNVIMYAIVPSAVMFGSVEPLADSAAKAAASEGVGAGAAALYAVPNATVYWGGWPCRPRIGWTVMPIFGKFSTSPVVPVTDFC